MKIRTRWINAYVHAVRKTPDGIELSVWHQDNTSDRPNASILFAPKDARKLAKQIKP